MEPAVEVKKLIGQSVQVEAPDADEKVPPLHARHAPGRPLEPALQVGAESDVDVLVGELLLDVGAWVQLADLATLVSPSLQAMHVVDPAEAAKVLLLQVRQTVDAREAVNVPGGQLVHTVNPRPSTYVPTLQSTQTVDDRVGAKVPSEHATQELAAIVVEKVPSRQPRHPSAADVDPSATE